MRRRLVSFLSKVHADGFPEGPDIMPRVIQRYRVKLLEEIEHNPHEAIVDRLLPELLFPCLQHSVGQRVSQVMDILDELETKDDKFWLELLNHWLLQRPMVEVQAIPDPSFAEALELEKKQGELARQEALGEAGMAEKGRRLGEAITANRKELSSEYKLQLLELYRVEKDVSELPTKNRWMYNPDQDPFPLNLCC